MTAKHDFIADNPHIAYSSKPDTSTPGVMILRFTVDDLGDGKALDSMPSEKPSEVFSAMKDGIIIESLINLTSSGELAAIAQFIGIDYSAENSNLVIESPIAQLLGLLNDDEWELGDIS